MTPAELRAKYEKAVSGWNQGDTEPLCIESDILAAIPAIAAAWGKAESDREALLTACREALRLNHLSDFNPLVNRQSVMGPLRNALAAIALAEERK